MGGKLKIGRAFGIDVFVHWSFILAPIYVAYQSMAAKESWQETALMLVILIAVFACVLLHEYGHALMARYFGVGTRDIIITPIGGLARLERMPRSPKQEFFITIAGPLVNLGIALIVIGYLFATGQSLRPRQLTDFAQILLWMNGLLFAFNLIPAFPMDGGRILRSILASFVSHEQATAIAGYVGQLFAGLFFVYGLWHGQLGLMAVGVFIFLAATAEIANSKRMMQAREVVMQKIPPGELFENREPNPDGSNPYAAPRD